MKTYKIIFMAVFISSGFYLAEVAGSACFVYAATDTVKSTGRKGLPLEMVISADDLRKNQLRKNNFLLLDARSEKSYEDAHVQGALLPLTAEYYKQEALFKKGISDRSPDADEALRENMKKYPRNLPVVTYCSSGGCQASAVLALQIKRLGFKDVRAMEDGVQTWGQKGYPIESGKQK